MRALFCPIAGRGFIYPMLGIGQKLTARGHTVAFATSVEFADVIAEAGFDRLPRGVKDGASFELARWGHPLAVAIQVRHVQHAIERFDPDVLLVSPLALGALVVGEIACLPVAMLGLSTFLWPVADAGRGMRSADPEASWRHAEMLRLYNQARGLFGQRPYDGRLDESPLLVTPHLLQSVPELEPLAAGLPAAVKMVGSCLHEAERPDAELMAWLEEGRPGEPLVYLQHGSVFDGGGDYWPTFAAAAQDAGVRVAASLGRRRGAVAPFTDSRFLLRPHVPQGPVLERASAVVSSGNTTAVLGALTHGLPSLLLPNGGEQRAMAIRCSRAGTAVVLGSQTPAAPLRAALEKVLTDAGLRAAAGRLRAAFSGYEGPTLVVGALEELGLAPAVRSGAA